MDEQKILEHLSNGIEQAPIQLSEIIKAQPRVMQLKHDEITKQMRVLPSIRIVVAVASFFFLVMLTNFQIQYRTVDSRIYLDINPSILLETNRHDKVIDIISLNLEGNDLIEGYRFKGKTLEQVTIELVDTLVLSNYLSKEDNLLLLSVYNEKNEKANLQKSKIKDVILQHLVSNDIHPIILTQAIDPSNTIKDMAVAYNISEGKMTLIRNLIILSPKLEVDALATLTLNQLIGLAKYLALDLSPIIEKQELDQIVLPETIKEIYNDIDGDEAEADDDSAVSTTVETTTATTTVEPTSTTESTTTSAPINDTRMSAANARQAVINKFGGIIEKMEYAYDDNNPHYKGEAVKEGSRVVFELNAKTERFTKWDVSDDKSWDSFAEAMSNMITMNQAANLVISKSGLSNTFVQKIDFKWDDSEPLYQGEAFNKGVKYTFEIYAFSGEFQKWDSSDGDDTWSEKYYNLK